MLPIAIVINLFGPLGLIGGGLSVLAIGLAVAYNFYFKFTIFSWLPLALYHHVWRFQRERRQLFGCG
jgi:membrane protein implicated in regulation of membrane protease activity